MAKQVEPTVEATAEITAETLESRVNLIQRQVTDFRNSVESRLMDLSLRIWLPEFESIVSSEDFKNFLGQHINAAFVAFLPDALKPKVKEFEKEQPDPNPLIESIFQDAWEHRREDGVVGVVKAYLASTRNK
jgi:hypothetical protein